MNEWSSRQSAVKANVMENLALAETKDQADWELLGKIARQSNDEKIREVLKSPVSEVESEEDDHVAWAKEQMARLAFEATCR